uniref:Thioredoxin-fold protein n=1 Tax=Pithovirus LCPAC104 TaxID=2506589 RepID=A0A481Z4H2_9VIRU|nr:MAG: thioredoxin-fold protein [Pithovirus LCPAC104]
MVKESVLVIITSENCNACKTYKELHDKNLKKKISESNINNILEIITIEFDANMIYKQDNRNIKNLQKILPFVPGFFLTRSDVWYDITKKKLDGMFYGAEKKNDGIFYTMENLPLIISDKIFKWIKFQVENNYFFKNNSDISDKTTKERFLEISKRMNSNTIDITNSHRINFVKTVITDKRIDN